MLWNKLNTYGILQVSRGEFEDDHLLKNGYGITDIVKVPRGYGNEPSTMEYQEGTKRIIALINKHNPSVLFFVYKAVLDNILKHEFKVREKSKYGFNPDLEATFHTKVFVFPMPGTPCNRELAHSAMTELKKVMN